MEYARLNDGKMLTAARPSNPHAEAQTPENVQRTQLWVRGSELNGSSLWDPKPDLQFYLINGNTQDNFYDGHDSKEAKPFSFLK